METLKETVPTLRQITAEDVGLEAGTAGINDNQDPLLNFTHDSSAAAAATAANP